MAIAIWTYLCENTFLTQVCALLVCSFVGAVKTIGKLSTMPYYARTYDGEKCGMLQLRNQ